MEDRCVICGTVVPEGREVCSQCANSAADSNFQWNPYSHSWTPKPAFKHGQVVKFRLHEGDWVSEVIGTVEIVDEFGTFEQNVEPSYDVLVRDAYTDQFYLYKHLRQHDLTAVKWD